MTDLAVPNSGLNLEDHSGAESWARRIGGAWQKSVDAIFETGRLIAEAKAALPHGAFTDMVETKLPFGARAAQRLMAIAADEKLTNPTHVSHLPASWGTLYELTKLDTETFQRRIKEGTIRPDMQRREVETGGARSIMASREQPKTSLDYFPTPPFATRALMNDVLPHLGIDPRCLGIVAEPCCGEGHMSGVLQEYGLDVRASDIADFSKNGRSPPGWVGQRDYLVEAAEEVDWTVFNPPFGDLTLQFVLLALAQSRRGVAVFVRQQWLEGIERYQELFSTRPPTLYAQFAERVPLCEGKWDPFGTTATAYCWLVWVKDMAPQPPLWIPPGRRKAYLNPDDIERFTAHPVIACQRVLAPFATSELTDEIIREAYAGEVIDFEACMARLAREAGVAASKLQIRRRANQLKLGDRDRQREAVRAANAARAEP